MPDDIRSADIRSAPTAEYWTQFNAKWTGLLSYRYLGRRDAVLDEGVAHDSMPLRSDMRNPVGGVTAAPLCIAAPESGGMNDDLYVPNPVTASMQILDDARDVRQVEIRPETIHVGRRMGFSRSLIVDAANPARIIALSQGMGVSLGSPPPGFQAVDNPPIELEDSPSLPPLHQVFGARRGDSGVWELPPLRPELASPDSALHLGPIHVTLEAAATDLAVATAGTDRLQIENWQVMFVSRGKVGPFVVSGDSTVGSLGTVGCRVTLVDDGNEHRVVAVGSATFRPVD